jgi:hypothetical protein
MTFEITDEMQEKVNNFHTKCKGRYTGAIGGGEKYIFMPFSIGMGITYVCKCGKELDLSEVDKW